MAIVQNQNVQTQIRQTQAAADRSVRNQQDREYEDALVQQLIRDTAPDTPTTDVTSPGADWGDASSPRAQFVPEDGPEVEPIARASTDQLFEVPLTLPPEPKDGPDAVFMRIRLPNGTNVCRNFHRTDTIRDVRTFIYQQIDER